MARRMRLALVLLVGGAPLGCGPSFQALYEGDARFEHCYALDANAQAAMSKKAECWKHYDAQYAWSQPVDRVRFARARTQALSVATQMPTDEALMMAAPGARPDEGRITAPAPTSAYAPPPKVLPVKVEQLPRREVAAPHTPEIVDAGVVAGPVPVPAPGAVCQGACEAQWRSCGGACGNSARACEKCTRSYRSCMQQCFR